MARGRMRTLGEFVAALLGGEEERPVEIPYNPQVLEALAEKYNGRTF